jgi:GNAT superfamily N-acetyltransferase
MTARLATAEDAPRLTALINAAYREAENYFIDGDRIDEREVHERLAAGGFLLIDGVDGSLQACVFLRVQGNRAYLGLLAVDPSLQKQGIGGKLLDEAENYCAARGCLAIDIEVVNLRTELLPRYEARGFRRTGTSAFDDTRLRKSAHFVTMSKDLAPRR